MRQEIRTVPGTALGDTRAALRNIAAWNPRINAMLTVLGDDAERTAEDLDLAAERGEWAGLLHGMTISLKDNIDLAGQPSTAATKFLRHNVANRDAFVTERLKRNGAVIVGKANLHEWVFGPTSQSKHFGPCRNPWDVTRIPGGSSGGSGAAVASGMCIGSIGSDTGGSIRIPAALDGVAGLRPTVGRISCRGSIAVSAPFDTLGPLARRVSDVARIFAVIAGHDPEDPMSIDEPLPNFLPSLNEPVAGLRLGVMRRWFFEDLHPDLVPAVEAALAVYRDLGVEIVEIDLGDVERANALLAFTVVLADAYALHKDRLATNRGDFGEDILQRYDIGAKVTGAQYAEAMRWMEGWRHRLRGTFGQVDAIFSPTTPVPAPVADGLDFIETVRAVTRYTFAWSAAGVPALAVPCGFT